LRNTITNPVFTMERTNRIKSLHRAALLLKCFSPEKVDFSVAEIARRLGIHRTTAYRIMMTLMEDGLLQRDDKTEKYTIGPILYALGSLYLSTTDIIKAAGPVIKTLNELTGEAINLGIFDKGNVIFIMKEEAKHAVREPRHVGAIIPAYGSAMGKAMLSELDEETLDRIYPDEILIPTTEKTIKTKTELKKELKEIKKTGVSIDHEGSWIGVEGIGSVIRDASGKVTAATSISGPIYRISDTIRAQWSALVKLGASLISYRLGYQDGSNPVHNIEEIRTWWQQNVLDSASQVSEATEPSSPRYGTS
jgi:IclR family KDG regulon transcriptional repressor